MRQTIVTKARDRVLLVEDHPALRDVLSRHLRAALHVEVDAAGTWEEAAKVLRDGGVGVVCCDLNLGAHTARELVPLMHTIDPDLRILVISGDPLSHFAADAHAAGAHAAVSKAAGPQAIATAVRAELEYTA